MVSDKTPFYKTTDFWVFIGEVIFATIINVISFIWLSDPKFAWFVLVLSLTVLIVKNTLYFSLKKILDEERSLLEETNKNIKLEDVMKSYNSVQPELVPYAQRLLSKFKYNIEEVLVRDKRTGKLDKNEYYDILCVNINNLKADEKIWAYSTLLDNEWDPTDTLEDTLMTYFINADKKGVKTDRIFTFRNDELLNPKGQIPDNNISDKIFAEKYKEYVVLKNLLPYLIEKSTAQLYHYPNTKSFVVEKTIWKKNRDLLGYGFCAFKHKEDANKKDIFLKDTSLDTVDDQKLCGEILYDKEKIEAIDKVFSELIQSVSTKSLKAYVFRKSNDNAKTFLKNNGVTMDSSTDVSEDVEKA